MLLSYNILPEKQDQYLRFVLSELMPNLQKMGLRSAGVWHTAYGDYPMRLITFVSESREEMDAALEGETWRTLENRLKAFVTDYSCRVVPYTARFQF